MGLLLLVGAKSSPLILTLIRVQFSRTDPKVDLYGGMIGVAGANLCVRPPPPHVRGTSPLSRWERELKLQRPTGADDRGGVF